MRVVNQARNSSIDIDRIAVVIASSCVMGEMLGRDFSFVLGKYESDERASEVFEQMHKAYSNDVMNTIRFDNGADLNQVSEKLGMNSLMVEDIRNESMMAVVDSRSDVFYMPIE